MRFGSAAFSIRNSIIGMRSQTSEESSSVVYTAMIAWSVGELGKSTDTCTCAVSRGLSVVDGGYEHQGKRYRSLSAVACAITDTQWSGPLFFGLRKSGGGR